MRRDRRAPALYELMQTRPHAGPPIRPGRPAINPATLPDAEERLSWFSPGRVIRVPTGYLVVALLLSLALAIAGYIIGYKKRDRDFQRQAEQALARQFEGVTDPLAIPSPSSPPPVSPGAPSAERNSPSLPLPGSSPIGRGTPPAQNPQNTGRLSPGRVVLIRQPADDPRQIGQNYLVVAQLAQSEAERAANFLASKGLEIAVVPVDNRPSTSFVVVVRGFGPGEWYGPDGKHLERDVQALGREYKRDHKGPVDFSDAWWQKFK